jgi:hypothetical protein
MYVYWIYRFYIWLHTDVGSMFVRRTACSPICSLLILQFLLLMTILVNANALNLKKNLANCFDFADEV